MAIVLWRAFRFPQPENLPFFDPFLDFREFFFESPFFFASKVAQSSTTPIKINFRFIILFFFPFGSLSKFSYVFFRWLGFNFETIKERESRPDGLVKDGGSGMKLLIFTYIWYVIIKTRSRTCYTRLESLMRAENLVKTSRVSIAISGDEKKNVIRKNAISRFGSGNRPLALASQIKKKIR